MLNWSFLPPTVAWVAPHHCLKRSRVLLQESTQTLVPDRRLGLERALMAGGETDSSILKFICTAMKHPAEAE